MRGSRTDKISLRLPTLLLTAIPEEVKSRAYYYISGILAAADQPISPESP